MLRLTKISLSLVLLVLALGMSGCVLGPDGDQVASRSSAIQIEGMFFQKEMFEIQARRPGQQTWETVAYSMTEANPTAWFSANWYYYSADFRVPRRLWGQTAHDEWVTEVRVVAMTDGAVMTFFQEGFKHYYLDYQNNVFGLMDLIEKHSESETKRFYAGQ